jgi:Ca-activated chloride channel homolog
VIKGVGMSTSWMTTIAVLATIPVCIAGAQLPQQELPAKERRPTVTVPFFAVEGRGNQTSAATQMSVSVLDNKTAPQSIVAIQTARELPLRLGVLIDTSNSVRTSRMHQAAVRATSELLKQVLKAPDDMAFFVSFAATPKVTGLMNRDAVPKFKVDLTPGSGTALFDAVYLACTERMPADPTKPTRRVLVLLSDGSDNLSHVNHEQAIAAAQKAGAVIFAVSTGENSSPNLDDSRLQQLADRTGGQAFVYLHRDDVPKVFSSIRGQIENMYAVTFVPADLGKTGQYHSIELKMTSDTKVKLRAPKGYYVTAQVQ